MIVKTDCETDGALHSTSNVQCDDSGAGACAEQWHVQCRSTHTADMSFFGDIKDKMEDWAEDKLEEALNSISQDGELDGGLVQSMVNTEWWTGPVSEWLNCMQMLYCTGYTSVCMVHMVQFVHIEM